MQGYKIGFVFTQMDVKKFLSQKYGLKSINKIFSLGSYVDCNYYIRNDTTIGGEIHFQEYVIKFTSLAEDPNQIFLETVIMNYLNKHAQNFKVSQIVSSLNGKMIEQLIINEKIYYSRLIKFVKGKNISEVQEDYIHLTKGQLSKQFLMSSFQFNLGKAMGQFSLLLSQIKNDSIQYQGKIIDAKLLPNTSDIWNVSNFLSIKQCILKIKEKLSPEMFQMGMNLCQIFQNNSIFNSNMLQKCIIHHDACGENVILSDIYNKDYNSRFIKCILDFGDMVYSYSICQLVTTLSHIPSSDKSSETLLNRYAKIIVGYMQYKFIKQEEWQVLLILVYARLAQVYLLGYYLNQQRLGNPHLLLTITESWQLSQILKSHSLQKQYKFKNLKDHIQKQTLILKAKVQKLSPFAKQIQL